MVDQTHFCFLIFWIFQNILMLVNSIYGDNIGHCTDNTTHNNDKDCTYVYADMYIKGQTRQIVFLIYCLKYRRGIRLKTRNETTNKKLEKMNSIINFQHSQWQSIWQLSMGTKPTSSMNEKVSRVWSLDVDFFFLLENHINTNRHWMLLYQIDFCNWNRQPPFGQVVRYGCTVYVWHAIAFCWFLVWRRIRVRDNIFILHTTVIYIEI